MDKTKLRKELRQRRRSLGAPEQLSAGLGLKHMFFRHQLHLRYKRIGFYWPNDGEIDARLLVDQLIAMGKDCYLPVLDPLGKNRVSFHKYIPGAPMTTNHFDIYEPIMTPMLHTWALDLILMPLVGFDEEGNRLGMGKGFYDRTLEFKRHCNRLGPKLIGLAHNCQKVDHLESNHWDVPMDGILTCSQFIEIHH